MIGRTEIAALALQGIVSSTDEDGLPLAAPKFAAARAVEYADALLEELAKIPPPASIHESPKEGPPSGCSAGEAGDTKGAASPRAAERVECRQDARNRGAPLAPAPADPAHAAGTDPASSVQVFDCEARFPNDPPCALMVSLDPVTKGRFCTLHLAQMTESARREMHRLHGHRNRPATLAHRIAEAL